MTMQHTPGPIFVDEGNGCFFLTKEACPRPVPVGLAYRLDDARLYAAAPGLLEGSTWAEPFLRDLIGRSGALLTDNGRAALDAWTAAIAEARGED